jgi:hypothetical protein
MADFATSSSLEVEVDSNSIRRAKQQIEDDLGDITVSVEASTASAGPMAGATPDGGRRFGGRVGRRGSPAKIQAEQLEVLEEINENIEKAEASGGGGAGIRRGIIGGMVTAGVGLQGTLLGMGAVGAMQTEKLISGDISVEEMPLYQGLQGLTQDLESDFTSLAQEFGTDLSSQVHQFDRELGSIQPPDLGLGLVDAVEAAQAGLDSLRPPDWLVGGRRDINPPRGTPGSETSDEALPNPGFEDGPGFHDPPADETLPNPGFEDPVPDPSPPPVDEALPNPGFADPPADETLPNPGFASSDDAGFEKRARVDVNANVDFRADSLRREVERGVRRELGDFDLKKEVNDIVKREIF